MTRDEIEELVRLMDSADLHVLARAANERLAWEKRLRNIYYGSSMAPWPAKRAS